MKLAVFLAILTCVASAPIHRLGHRDILGLLGGDEAVAEAPQALITSAIMLDGITSRLTNSRLSSSTTRHQLTDSNLGASTLKPGSLTVSIGDKGPRTRASAMETGSGASPSFPASFAGAEEAPPSPPGELTEWKIIGISIICITFIAIVVILITFFDNWWGFVKDVFCGSKNSRGTETFLRGPDWKRTTWEVKLASEDGHRYPTMSSVGSLAKPVRDSGADFWVPDPGPGRDYVAHAEMALGRNMGIRKGSTFEGRNPIW